MNYCIMGRNVEEQVILHGESQALKGLILERMGKLDEALSVCINAKELLFINASILIDDLTLRTLQIVFQRLDHYLPPALHAGTLEPVIAQDWSPLFPDELIKKETSNARFIGIPKEVVDIYA